MTEIDLIPEGYRKRELFRRWYRILFLGSTVVLGLCLSLYTLFHYRSKGLEAEMTRLQKTMAINVEQRAELARLQIDEEGMQAQWKLLNGLRSGVDVRSILQMIDRSLPQENVWFQSWEFRRAGIVVQSEQEAVSTGYFIVVPRGAEAKQDADWEVQTHMTIRAQSRDHEALSIFVRKLLSQPEVSDVRIVRTGQRRYNAANVVEFELAIVINSAVESV